MKMWHWHLFPNDWEWQQYQKERIHSELRTCRHTLTLPPVTINHVVHTERGAQRPHIHQTNHSLIDTYTPPGLDQLIWTLLSMLLVVGLKQRSNGYKYPHWLLMKTNQWPNTKSLMAIIFRHPESCKQGAYPWLIKEKWQMCLKKSNYHKMSPVCWFLFIYHFIVSLCISKYLTFGFNWAEVHQLDHIYFPLCDVPLSPLHCSNTYS